MKTILILASNPQGTTVLNLSREIRDIQDGLKRSSDREEFKVEICLAVRPLDLRRAIIEIKPEIVHICGHGEGEKGLCFENDQGEIKLVSKEALSELFRIASQSVECVVINTCYSEVQAEAIAEHILYVVGMNQAIKDKTAIEFAIGFYDGIGNGKSIEESFDIGKLNILLDLDPSLDPNRKAIYEGDELEKTIKQKNLPENLIPVLYKSDNLEITTECTDPEDYTGTIWTHIIPEVDNCDQYHIVTISWVEHYWQEAIKIPQEGILLIYRKIHKDKSSRRVTVSPANKSYINGAERVTTYTKILNGHLNLPDVSNYKDINKGWKKATMH